MIDRYFLDVPNFTEVDELKLNHDHARAKLLQHIFIMYLACIKNGWGDSVKDLDLNNTTVYDFVTYSRLFRMFKLCPIEWVSFYEEITQKNLIYYTESLIKTIIHECVKYAFSEFERLNLYDSI